ncbi:type I glutamate--ammonia ligase [Microcella alkalica]|uniref:Glutamine synthetase n=1 Tax=Microcella alkalica TaxID=355930 RepID=A0A839E9G2_9MICO|nr:glutamine synthetase family protein [Microcella alkalica]MBA8847813.1 glutamine synthetase [Microcella alkalica]
MSRSLVNLQSELAEAGIDVLRVIYADVIGTVRSKDLLVSQLDKISHGGPAFSQGVWITTTQGGVLDGGSILSDGLSDFISQIVPESWRALPWEPGVAYVVAGAANPDMTPNEFAPRTLLERVVGEYAALGLQPVIGPELEFYIADRNSDGSYRRALTQPGRVYSSGATVDPKGTFLHLLRMLDQLRIGVFAGNHEFSPSQYEVNIWHGESLDACDRIFMLKAAVKDLIARVGQAATFSGKPWSDEGGSGFHLHVSVVDVDGENLMHSGHELSEIALHMIAGIVEHGPALTALCNPTVNAFKRLGPDTLAPYRANWGHDNRSAMVRIPPERGGGTRLEMRLGDGAANPYLMTAAILAAGLDGIRRMLVAPPPAVGYSYEDESQVVLPMTLGDALDALRADTALIEILGGPLVDVFEVMKRDELERYAEAVDDPSTRDVTEWEVKEYFLDL